MHTRSGQGLLETIVALGVITTGLVAAFTLVLAQSRASEDVALRRSALELAREGIEVVRSIRDANALAAPPLPWANGLTGSPSGRFTGVPVFTPATDTWTIEYGASAFTDPATAVYRVTSGSDTFWTQGSGAYGNAVPTAYRRRIGTFPICRDGSVVPQGIACDPSFDPPGPMVGLHVESVVEWGHRGRTSSVTLEQDFYDIR